MEEQPTVEFGRKAQTSAGRWFESVSSEFILFRMFDIFKPGPVGRMDDLKSGTGIMMDDVIAGILALLVTQSLVYFIV